MIIRFLTARTYKSHCLTYPLRVFSEYLKDKNIYIRFHYSETPTLQDCDILCLSQESFGASRLKNNPPDRYKFLDYFRPRVNTIIWFDTSDGTGTTSFSLIPYINLYAKNQLLRDRIRYTQVFYSNELFTDYYHRNLNIEDDQHLVEITKRGPIQHDQINKLAISWNLGLGDWLTFNGISSFERGWKIFSPWTKYPSSYSIPEIGNRTIDVSFRGRKKYNRETSSYQRQETYRQLSEMSKMTKYKIRNGGKITYRDYRTEMRNTKIVCSPFGLGEINAGRDFECFADGAMLYKPDMSHLETWPDYFQPYKTYLPHAWDFSDFQERLFEFLESPSKIEQIAQAGQKEYFKTLSANGGEAFAQHFSNLLMKTQKISQDSDKVNHR